MAGKLFPPVRVVLHLGSKRPISSVGPSLRMPDIFWARSFSVAPTWRFATYGLQRGDYFQHSGQNRVSVGTQLQRYDDDNNNNNNNAARSSWCLRKIHKLERLEEQTHRRDAAQLLPASSSSDVSSELEETLSCCCNSRSFAHFSPVTAESREPRIIAK
ncbi:hypothetical protein EYF80_040092 [Liparis tanakae]|uniref:Uncharacterized protein n=1 Tax=Liparis tanakae TaxID=230148 RepID=A0A4Z2G8U3_9TELE|nr:hypothetical protein EYF80_040092 [Liparis tanakae]